MRLMGLCNHEVALRDLMLCNAFLKPDSLGRAGHRSALTPQSVEPECLLAHTAEAKRPLLHARDILCATVRAHYLPGHIHDTLVLVAFGLWSLDAPLPA